MLLTALQHCCAPWSLYWGIGMIPGKIWSAKDYEEWERHTRFFHGSKQLQKEMSWNPNSLWSSKAHSQFVISRYKSLGQLALYLRTAHPLAALGRDLKTTTTVYARYITYTKWRRLEASSAEQLCGFRGYDSRHNNLWTAPMMSQILLTGWIHL